MKPEIKERQKKRNPVINSILSSLPYTKENKYKSILDERQKQDTTVKDILNDARIMHQNGNLDFDTGYSIFKHVSPHFYNDRYNSDSE